MPALFASQLPAAAISGQPKTRLEKLTARTWRNADVPVFNIS
jgi:hypothetical protein